MADDDKLATTTKKPSWVKEFVERAKGDVKVIPAVTAAAPYASVTGDVLAGYGEALVIGGLSGTARAMFGNEAADTAAGAVAGLSALASIATAGTHSGLSTHAKNVGIAAMAIFTDRKTESLVGGGQKTTASGGGGGGGGDATAHGEEEGDPVIKAAERLHRR